MPDEKKRPPQVKPVYEPPRLIELRTLARGVGKNCSLGTAPGQGPCKPGGVPAAKCKAGGIIL